MGIVGVSMKDYRYIDFEFIISPKKGLIPGKDLHTDGIVSRMMWEAEHAFLAVISDYGFTAGGGWYYGQQPRSKE